MRLSTLTAVFLVSMIAGLIATTPQAQADNGSQLRQIIADRSGTQCASHNAQGDHGSVGVGIAFDGIKLLISCYGDSSIAEIDPATGAKRGLHFISNASSLGAMAWDNDLKLLWACSNFNIVGTVNLSTNQFTPRFTTHGCFDGLAYDGTDKTFWTSDDVSTSIQHYSTAGALLSSQSVSGKIGQCGSSGIAVGGSKLYLANNGCSEIYEANKALSTSTLFATFPRRLEDLECDNVTFAGIGKGAIWSIDAYDNILNAWEIPAGSCFFGGQALADFRQTDAPWGSKKLYLRNECATVAAIGCAMTAVADVAASYGLELPGGIDITPDTLNTFLSTRMTSCYMNWGTVSTALGLGKATVLNETSPINQRLQAIDQALTDGNLAIIGVDSANPFGGKHFLVVYQKVFNPDGTVDYRILDPGFGTRTGKLLSETYGSPTDPDLNLQVRTFDSGVHPQRTFTLLGHSPIQIIVTDPQGRKTGFDPMTGTSLSEIAGATYLTDPGVANIETGTALPDTLYFQLDDPLDGTYEVRVVGTGVGPYTLDFSITTATGETSFTTLAGNATPGSQARYTVEISAGAVIAVTPEDVPNDVPAITLPDDATVDEGTAFTDSGSFVDPDPDSWTGTIDYGDGTGVQPLPLNPDKTFALSHVFADDGVYSVTVTVDDGAGGVGTADLIVTVENVAPTVLTDVDAATITCGQNNALLGLAVIDPGRSDTLTVTVDWGDGSPLQVLPWTSSGLIPHTYTGVGNYTAVVTAEDDDGAVGNGSTTFYVPVTVVGGGVLEPINQDGTSVFKSKSTIPIKVKLQDCDGTYPADLAPTISVVRVSGSTPSGVLESVNSSSAADTGNRMRFDATAQQYIYNLSAKSLSDPSATYRLTITIPATGQTIVVNFGLKP